jgi:YVTN family beta-propeller protein
MDLALSPDESRLVTANHTADTLSLVDVASGKVLHEIACGRRPAAVVFSPDGLRVLATAAWSGELHVFDVKESSLEPAGSLPLGFEPRGLAVSHDGRTAYVALSYAAAVAVVDLEKLQLKSKIAVDRWPRTVAQSPDGSRLAVGCSGDRTIAVIDTAKHEVAFRQNTEGINVEQLKVSRDGVWVYAPWMVYRQNIPNVQNIRIGWVLASRIGRVRLDEKARRQAISLDVPRQAMSDPYGIDLTPDETWIVCTSSGTHELLAYRRAELPFEDPTSPGDLAEQRVYANGERFFRVPLGGRPLAIRASQDNRHVFVANYLENCVQVVDLHERKLARTIPLGGPPEASLFRRGEAEFYDAKNSLDQWYSCQSCHYEGGTSAVTMDTLNDGSDKTFKTVLPLFGVTQTQPWTWHGWQQNLRESIHNSIQITMLGPEPGEERIEALYAYLDGFELPPNPYRSAGGELNEAAQRGQAVFQSAKAGCATCHNGPHFTDGKIHDVGLGSPKDKYQGYNTPSLIGLYRKVRYLHHGRAKSLEEVLTEYHDPANVTGQGELTEEERRDLIEYLLSL